MNSWFQPWTNRRVRRTAAALTLIGAAFIAVSQVEFRRPSTYTGPGPFVAWEGGILYFGNGSPLLRPDWWIYNHRGGTLGLDWFRRGRSWMFAASIALPTAGAVGGAGLAWWVLVRRAAEARRRRRSDPTRCAACRYDLRGLPSGTVCPECGAPGSALPPGRAG